MEHKSWRNQDINKAKGQGPGMRSREGSLPDTLLRTHFFCKKEERKKERKGNRGDAATRGNEGRLFLNKVK